MNERSAAPHEHDRDLEMLEIQLLLEGVYRRYGYDFREYAVSSLRRRILGVVRQEGLQSISRLQEHVLHDRLAWQRFLIAVTVNVTSFYRDPEFYRTLRSTVVPLLREIPFVRIWHAGCATGEEVYSLAILLIEEGLYDRCRIYATDINEAVLKRAKSGIYPLRSVEAHADGYRASGGRSTFAEYYTAKYDSAILKSSLRDRIVFAQHNLATDGSFNEFHLVLCRNVMIYFNRRLQDRVHTLIYSSLAGSGILCLGQKENLRLTPFESCYSPLSAEERIYQRVT